MTKFKHAHSEVLPSFIGDVHPNQSSISKEVQDMDDWDCEKQSAYSSFTIDVKN
jgi:hypothetical protein